MFVGLILLLAPLTVRAEVYTLGGGDFATRDVDIIKLGEVRPGGLFPVIYVFDKEKNFTVTRGAIEILQWAEVMPPVLLVGISTEDRFADYTPNYVAKEQETSGNADKLLGYIDSVVRPYLAAHYPVSQFEVLHGHSLSGLFVLHALLTRPARFNGAIAIGSSVWWDDDALPKQAEQDCSANIYRKIFMALSGGDRSRSSVERFAMACRDEDMMQGGLILKEYPDEDHVTEVTPATHDGLRYVFDAWNMDPLLASRDVDALERRLSFIAEVAGGTPYISVTGFANLGRSFTAQGDPLTAIRVLDRANNIAPDEIIVLNYLGEAYREAGLFDEACATFRHSFEVATKKKSPMVRWISRQIDGLNDNISCKAV